MRMLLRLVVGAIATAAAVWLIPGIRVVAETDQQYILIMLGVAAIMGVVNAVIKPFTQVLSFCLVVVTFGLFLLVINASMLALTAWIAQRFGIGFFVDGFWPALWGSVVISFVSSLLGGLLGAKD
ncbi:phage holin family protein [Arachnia rubra]|uniref:Phage holin family protein n=1 Tax=Arachnia rubra TaxID=1547448 RepID=A0ABX7Y969_9ACTN|nr:phage holin family protein [Arachnia rubra]MBB1570703.1 phage holin family protein [Propionibacterium sp.]MDO4645092.1 phage holin family protein [Propionibacteriaceae bacterium]QUC09342.1 phage holin family protein [Arachnia rubra]